MKQPLRDERFSLDLAYFRNQAAEAVRSFFAPLNGVYEAAAGTSEDNGSQSDAPAHLLNTRPTAINSPASNNSVDVSDLPLLISNVHAALSGLGKRVDELVAAPEPAVSIRSSIKPDYIICLEDGKKLKMLKRHLMTNYNLTPDQYREKWGLSADYPMVAPNYAEERRALAKKVGLGTKRKRAAGIKAGASNG